ncbi:MAG: hypothetical protein IKU24_05985, partial [Clostridia bacterium]|nr:hypothetical protein [Clostridia bacterium]
LPWMKTKPNWAIKSKSEIFQTPFHTEPKKRAANAALFSISPMSRIAPFSQRHSTGLDHPFDNVVKYIYIYYKIQKIATKKFPPMSRWELSLIV